MVVKTILVVEDDMPLQYAIKFKLEKEGFAVIAVGSGEEALQVLKSHLSVLIWLDLFLPGMGGWRFLEMIRQNPVYKELPVMIVSVLSDKERIRKAFELNVVDYIVKSENDLGYAVGKVKQYYERQGK